MGIFDLLGEAIGNIPKVVENTATGISQFVEQNFNIAGANQKVAEMGTRLLNSGQSANFSAAVVKPGQIGFDTSVMYGSPQTESVPSSLFPYTKSASTNLFKVKISQEPDGSEGIFDFVFEVMPRIDEARSVDYEQVTPVHHPGSIQKYRNTSNRSWRIAGRLMSRNSEEASRNLEMLNLVRAWMMPYYGVGTGNSRVASKLGAPPPILTFSAYGNKTIGPVKCVLKDANWSFDNSLDYIPTIEGTPFPVLLEINISLEEAWSPSEYSGFNLELYKKGILGDQGAFKRTVAIPPAPAAAIGVQSDTSNDEVTYVGSEPKFGEYVPRDQWIRATAQAQAEASNELLRESRRGQPNRVQENLQQGGARIPGQGIVRQRSSS